MVGDDCSNRPLELDIDVTCGHDMARGTTRLTSLEELNWMNEFVATSVTLEIRTCITKFVVEFCDLDKKEVTFNTELEYGAAAKAQEISSRVASNACHPLNV